MDLTDLSWPAVAALPRTTPIVFPVAALEQHGRHMPVFTDSLLLGEVVRRVKQTPAADKCLFAPLQWLGNSHHHLDHPGTLSATPRVYLDLLKDLARCFLTHGFTRLVFVNGSYRATLSDLSALPTGAVVTNLADALTGDVGAALFAAACLDVDARYPILDVAQLDGRGVSRRHVSVPATAGTARTYSAHAVAREEMPCGCRFLKTAGELTA